MSDDFFERLREDAAPLRFEGRDALWTRLPAKIRARIDAQPDVTHLLARWFRPVTASFVTMALVAALSIVWIERSRDAALSVDAIGSNSVEITVGGDTFNLAE